MAGTQLTVGVLGAGTMGSGIAVTTARAGHRTVLRDLDDERVAAGLGRVRTFLDKSVRLGKLPAERAEQAKRDLSGTTKLDGLSECDVVVEAIFEDVELKRRTFGALDEICKPDTLFHTNTSTLSVTAIAAGSTRPERVVGTHYCNPAPLMKLVEVVHGRRTSDEAYQRTVRFLESIGKVTVAVRDSPGFIVNRFLIPFENNCIRALESGLGTVESIDRAVHFGLGYPMGTFTLLDIVGLDVHRAVSMSLYDQLRDPRFAPPPLVDQMIAAGQLGRKTGKGFYDYEDTTLFGS
ncbi:MAG: 3-hydroxyacyl-CoA dehydrogenase family protein [Pseudonocardiaceae bacterium]|nr:3-hydroxyacyl-CoA dehydrogenase family protein [Pseudonocardiaceae bacterium]